MKTHKALPAIRWMVVLCLLMLLVGFAPPYGWAQSGAVCGPAPPIKTVLDGLPEQTPAQTDWQYHEQRAAAIQALRRQYPCDVFVEKAYVDEMDGRTEKEKVIAEFKARHEQNPGDAKVDYLYALALVGRQSPEAIKLLSDALTKDPYFAPPHLELVSIYSSPVFMDKEQRIAHMKDYLEACPSSFDGYASLTRVDDKDLQRVYAAKLRALIANRTDLDAVWAYTTLWSLEFKAYPPSDHATLRKQVAQDLERIRQLKLEDKRLWYSALEEGYKLVNDQKHSDLVADQEQTRFPSRWTTPAQSKWSEGHHYPGIDAPPDKKQAFYKELLPQTAQWVKELPNMTNIWQERLNAMTHLDDVPLADMKAAVDQTIKVTMSNAGPDGPGFYDMYRVFNLLANKHIEPELQVELAGKELDQLEIESKQPYNDLYATKENLEGNRVNQAYFRLMTLNYEADGYLQLKQPDKAQLALAPMDERLEELKSLAGDKQDRKKNYSALLANYWGLMAREAELRGRKLDAMAFYENALLARLDAQQKPETGMKDELADNARELWASLGGSDEGWKLWYGRRADALANEATLTWENASQPLASFELTDLSGKTWNLAALKGKTTFLNFWASW